MGNKIVVANLKMNLNVVQVSEYLKKINKNINNKNVIICPTSIYIPYFLKQNYKVGIQNIFYKDKGAFTGEISPNQASSIGIEYVIIGHSERRKKFFEKNDEINKKIKASLENDLKVILCIGESIEEHDLLKTNKVIENQITLALRNIKDLTNVIIAYEPIWTIGTNVIPSFKEINNVTKFIKSVILKINFNIDIKVLYGGSVNEFNIEEIIKNTFVDGVLVGDVSIDADKLLKIIEVTC